MQDRANVSGRSTILIHDMRKIGNQARISGRLLEMRLALNGSSIARMLLLLVVVLVQMRSCWSLVLLLLQVVLVLNGSTLVVLLLLVKRRSCRSLVLLLLLLLLVLDGNTLVVLHLLVELLLRLLMESLNRWHLVTKQLEGISLVVLLRVELLLLVVVVRDWGTLVGRLEGNPLVGLLERGTMVGLLEGNPLVRLLKGSSLVGRLLVVWSITTSEIHRLTICWPRSLWSKTKFQDEETHTVKSKLHAARKELTLRGGGELTSKTSSDTSTECSISSSTALWSFSTPMRGI